MPSTDDLGNEKIRFRGKEGFITAYVGISKERKTAGARSSRKPIS
jgi:hypothetical protein